MLSVDVRFPGASLSGDTRRITVRTAGSHGWSYGGLKAWDAKGRVLSSRMEVRGDEVRLHVDTTGAAWPVQIDPLLTPATWLDAPSADDAFGGIVADLADVNGDGYADFGITSDTAVYVYHGSASGPVLATSVGMAFTNLGRADVNGDGYDDLLVGTTQGGRVYLGSAIGLDTAYIGLTVGGSGESTWMYGVGDVDGDGYEDVLFAQPNEENTAIDQGRVWLHLGSATGLALASSWSYDGASAYASLGTSVSAGDLDGDGLADIALGAPAIDDGAVVDAGAVYVFYGAAGGPAATPDATRLGTAPDARLGEAVLILPDADLDGDAELVTAEDGGTTWVYAGSSAGIPAGATWILGTDYVQRESKLAGCDVNGDGWTDLLVSNTTGEGGTGTSGVVPVWTGTGVDFVQVDTVYGAPDEAMGPDIACADGDADGFADILAGEADWIASGAADGRVLLTYGASTGPETMGTWDQAWTQRGASRFGLVLADGLRQRRVRRSVDRCPRPLRWCPRAGRGVHLSRLGGRLRHRLFVVDRQRPGWRVVWLERCSGRLRRGRLRGCRGRLLPLRRWTDRRGGGLLVRGQRCGRRHRGPLVLGGRRE